MLMLTLYTIVHETTGIEKRNTNLLSKINGKLGQIGQKISQLAHEIGTGCCIYSPTKMRR
jgi:hypothetical protein